MKDYLKTWKVQTKSILSYRLFEKSIILHENVTKNVNILQTSKHKEFIMIYHVLYI